MEVKRNNLIIDLKEYLHQISFSGSFSLKIWKYLFVQIMDTSQLGGGMLTKLFRFRLILESKE